MFGLNRMILEFKKFTSLNIMFFLIIFGKMHKKNFIAILYSFKFGK